jgi:hypothetical protein
VTALRRQGPKECADKTDTLREEGMSKEKRKVDYGVDAPGVIRNFLLAGIALLVLARFVPAVTVAE